MKLFRITLYFIIALIFLTIQKTNSAVLNQEEEEVDGVKLSPPKSTDVSDSVFGRVMKHIEELAQEKMKSSDILSKRKMSGNLPQSFPKANREKAMAERSDRGKWLPILGYPTDLYRFCVVPFARINYSKWCKNAYFDTPKKKICKYTT
jgi:hypothetical protein